eukprot:snap_masked-scaffold_61-processed-gene-0.40-mRNA-1 protein AED:1.00 eAED:1.00 QI:0/0/0/0/1/1/2/0/63
MVLVSRFDFCKYLFIVCSPINCSEELSMSNNFKLFFHPSTIIISTISKGSIVFNFVSTISKNL